MPPPVSDLVYLARLDVAFASTPERYTQHTIYILEDSLQRDRVRRTEKWKKKSMLGRGRFGVVNLEECIEGAKAGQLRAVKRLKKAEYKNYERELEAIALFSQEKYEHRFVKSLGWFESRSQIFIAMEYLPNGDLSKYLSVPLTEPENEAKVITTQLLEGLNFMHAHNFVHRDLKPGNVLVVSPGQYWWVKIADFGISKRDVEATALRTIAGTPQFLAPEVSGFQTSDTYTSAVDIWALGAITYTLLTGEPLFKDMGLLYQYAAGSMPFPTGALDTKGVSKEAIAFLTSMVAAKPDDRPQARACLCDPWIGRSEDLPTIQSQSLPSSETEDSDSDSYASSEAERPWTTIVDAPPSAPPQDGGQEVSENQTGDKPDLQTAEPALQQSEPIISTFEIASEKLPAIQQSDADRQAHSPTGAKHDNHPTQQDEAQKSTSGFAQHVHAAKNEVVESGKLLAHRCHEVAIGQADLRPGANDAGYSLTLSCLITARTLESLLRVLDKLDIDKHMTASNESNLFWTLAGCIPTFNEFRDLLDEYETDERLGGDMPLLVNGSKRLRTLQDDFERHETDLRAFYSDEEASLPSPPLVTTQKQPESKAQDGKSTLNPPQVERHDDTYVTRPYFWISNKLREESYATQRKAVKDAEVERRRNTTLSNRVLIELEILTALAYFLDEKWRDTQHHTAFQAAGYQVFALFRRFQNMKDLLESGNIQLRVGDFMLFLNECRRELDSFDRLLSGYYIRLDAGRETFCIEESNTFANLHYSLVKLLEEIAEFLVDARKLAIEVVKLSSIESDDSKPKQPELVRRTSVPKTRQHPTLLTSSGRTLRSEIEALLFFAEALEEKCRSADSSYDFIYNRIHFVRLALYRVRRELLVSNIVQEDQALPALADCRKIMKSVDRIINKYYNLPTTTERIVGEGDSIRIADLLKQLEEHERGLKAMLQRA